MHKDRQIKQEKRIKKLEELREREELIMMRDNHRMINHGGDGLRKLHILKSKANNDQTCMLAYSLNKNMRELDRYKKRPKSARLGLRV